jgi:hypothetical protein
MSIQQQIEALRNEIGQARSDQLLDVCENINAVLDKTMADLSAILEAQLRMNERLDKMEAAKLYVEPRGQ